MQILDKIQRISSPYPAGLKLLDYLKVRAARPFTPGDTQFMGRTIRYSDNIGFIHSVRELFTDETYRFQADKPNPHIIDAGANIGLSALYFKKLYPDSTVVAFEPDANIFSILEYNVSGLGGVELRRQAAWTKATKLNFYTEGSLAGSSEIDFLQKGRSIEVDAIRLRDEICKRPVDFLKIDIEGAENNVLFDIEDVLFDVKSLFFEYHSVPGKPQRLGEILEMIRCAGFRYTINGAHGPRLPFIDTVTRGFDLQLNVSCFR
jgi:FkbM family methyltransferase